MIYFDLFLTFLKIGLFTFGGGYAMLPMIQEEVSAHSWLNQSELIDFIAVSESTPGPFAVNIATFVGTRTGGIFGGLCATFGVVLPSFVIILFVARFYQKFKSSKLVAGAMNGLKPAVVGLIVRCGGCAGVQKVPSDSYHSAVSRYRSHSRHDRNGLKPTTGVVKSKMVYDRKKLKKPDF